MSTTLKGSFFSINLNTTPRSALSALKELLGTVGRMGTVSRNEAAKHDDQATRRKKAVDIYYAVKRGAGHLCFDFNEDHAEASLSWNGTASAPYKVTLDDQFVSCDCPDAAKNSRLCKHRMGLIGAVHAARKEVADLLVKEFKRLSDEELAAVKATHDAAVAEIEQEAGEIK